MCSPDLKPPRRQNGRMVTNYRLKAAQTACFALFSPLGQSSFAARKNGFGTLIFCS
jgi:hypothetical protein